MAPAVQGGEVLAHSGRLIAAIRIQKRRDVRQLNAKASEDQDLLQLFSFICLMSFDVYMKKQLIEKLIDTVLTK